VNYDVLILGAGPAGLTAAIYASRARLATLLVEKTFPGGQLMMCAHVENYPGYLGGPGIQLSEIMRQQAEKFGTESKCAEITNVDFSGREKVVYTAENEEIRSKTVILCLGAKPRRLNVPGETEFSGKGVSYCAVCDGALFKDKTIAVVGGGDTAVEDAVFLTRYAPVVHLIHRRDKFRAQRIIQERALANPSIKVHWNTVVKEISGKESVDYLVLENVLTGERSCLATDGVFILIGNEPNTRMLEGQIELDDLGYVLTDENMQTNVPGVFAAGDVRRKSLRQIITACADGAIAAVAAEKYIEALE
jgi:thioredoxin reductase (NADPH)